jgi:hypothetical protein
MQAAADSTALMLSKDAASLTKANLQTKANAYFKAMMTRAEAKNLAVQAIYENKDGPQVTVIATASMKTDFMGSMGFSSLKIGVDSKAV